MTYQPLVELLKQTFPKLGETQILFELNMALKRFCNSTRSLYKVATLTKSTDFVDSNSATGVYRWVIPQDLYEVKWSGDWWDNEMWIEDGYLCTNRDMQETTSRLEYTRYPVYGTAITDSVDLADEFCDALVAIVARKYWLQMGNAAMAAECAETLRRSMTDAIKFFNTRILRNLQTGSGGTTMKSTFKQGQTLVEGENTVTMDISFSSATSYALALNGNGISVNETVPAVRTKNTFKVVAAEALSNFEYIAVGN